MRGCKRLLLAPPTCAPLLRPRPAHAPSANHSTLSALEVAALRPQLLSRGGVELTVRAGGGVFIPEGWWHAVSSPEEV